MDLLRRARVLRRARRHVLFGIVLLAATALRAVAVLGYPGALWFPDSNSYLGVAVRPVAYPARPQAYAFFLRALEPAHSFVVVVIVQHVLVLIAAFAIYALLRRRFRVPRWAATLATVPLLFDGYQIQLEHQVLSDTLFEVLTIAAVVLVLWKPRPGWVLCGVAGLVLAVAVLTRSVGLPLLAVFAVFLLIRRVGWRAAGVGALACAVPLAGYAIWFHATWGVYGFSNSSGIFLFGRTAAFADCTKVRPPENEAFLCPEGPVALRGASPNYIWHNTPRLSRLPNWRKFTPEMNTLTGDFARRAILAQPGDYLNVVDRDFGRTFQWQREPYPTAFAVRAYEFPEFVKPRGTGVSVPGATVVADAYAYGGTDGGTPVVEPYAGFMRAYQHDAALPGTLFGMLMAAGLAGMLLLWRRLGGAALLPWGIALALVAVPPMTASFDYRYVLPAAPLVCLALAISTTEALRHPPRRRGRPSAAIPPQARKPASTDTAEPAPAPAPRTTDAPAEEPAERLGR
ncbi:MAG TPA: hypothetical protein VGL93_29345 [Streptosporangiaceae bacterium]